MGQRKNSAGEKTGNRKNALGRPLPAVVKDLVGSEQEPSGEPGCNVDGSKDETKVKLGPVKD